MKYFRDTFGQAEQTTEKQLGVSTYEIMNLEAEKVATGSDGLIILPYLMGKELLSGILWPGECSLAFIYVFCNP